MGQKKPQDKTPFWNDLGFRSVLYQIVAIAAVVLIGWYLVDNTLTNLAVRQINTGFGYLSQESSFAVSESVIAFAPSDTYGRALVVGLLNTLRVALVGIVLATIVGVLVGVARLSSNWLVARLATVYVETLRNIPVLLQLFFWYAVITKVLPSPRQALSPITGIYLSNRGFQIPAPMGTTANWSIILVFIAGAIASFVLYRWASRRHARTGVRPNILWANLGLIIGLPLVVWLALGAPIDFSVPELKGFNYRGGIKLTPEFAALLLGLVLYTGAFIAEIVRSGILSVSKGQWEAAASLGLKRGLVLRLVVLPQALRIIVPPVTSQYLNLTKNSSLAVAIGYPDLVSIANTTLNQTGQAIENIALIMAAYLTVSLAISAFMNWYNARIALVER